VVVDLIRAVVLLGAELRNQLRTVLAGCPFRRFASLVKPKLLTSLHIEVDYLLIRNRIAWLHIKRVGHCLVISDFCLAICRPHLLTRLEFIDAANILVDVSQIDLALACFRSGASSNRIRDAVIPPTLGCDFQV